MTIPIAQTVCQPGISRRHVLWAGAAFASMSLFPSMGWAYHPTRALKLHRAVIGKNLAVEYWAEGALVPEALRELNVFLRDPSNGEVVEIDPELFDFLYDIAKELGITGEISIMSGYRSPATNERLRRRNSAAARNSFHTKGKAVDISIPGYSAKSVSKVAIGLRRGGVGYYPESKYVHIDTGPVRDWEHT